MYTFFMSLYDSLSLNNNACLGYGDLAPVRCLFLHTAGVAGGSIVQGVLRVGDEIEVRPGIVTKDAEGNVRVSETFCNCHL